MAGTWNFEFRNALPVQEAFGERLAVAVGYCLESLRVVKGRRKRTKVRGVEFRFHDLTIQRFRVQRGSIADFCAAAWNFNRFREGVYGHLEVKGNSVLLLLGGKVLDDHVLLERASEAAWGDSKSRPLAHSLTWVGSGDGGEISSEVHAPLPEAA